MKHLVLLLVPCALLASSGCENPADGSLGSCATALTGTFEGDRTGILTVQVGFARDVNGEVTGGAIMEAVFVDEDEDETPVSAVMEEDGTIGPERATQVVQLEGTMDFDTCEGSGTWDFFQVETGTWELGLR